METILPPPLTAPFVFRGHRSQVRARGATTPDRTLRKRAPGP